MSTKYTGDVVAVTGEYQDRNTGQTKKRYIKVGAEFTHEDGRRSIKLDAVPVGPTFTGWLSIYPKRDQRPAHAAPAAPSAQPAEFDDELPF